MLVFRFPYFRRSFPEIACDSRLSRRYTANRIGRIGPVTIVARYRSPYLRTSLTSPSLSCYSMASHLPFSKPGGATQQFRSPSPSMPGSPPDYDNEIIELERAYRWFSAPASPARTASKAERSRRSSGGPR